MLSYIHECIGINVPLLYTINHVPWVSIMEGGSTVAIDLLLLQ